jgi:hypothetical protein
VKKDPSRRQPRTEAKGYKEENDQLAGDRLRHQTFPWLDNRRNIQQEAVCNRKSLAYTCKHLHVKT